MQDIYNDQTYLNNNPTWGEDDAYLKAEAITKLIKRNNVSFNIALEAGCGSGEILVQLEKKFPDAERFYGYDISRDVISIASKKQTEKIRFESGDIKSVGVYADLWLIIMVNTHKFQCRQQLNWQE